MKLMNINYDVILVTSSNYIIWNTSSKWHHKNFPFSSPPT